MRGRRKTLFQRGWCGLLRIQMLCSVSLLVGCGGGSGGPEAPDRTGGVTLAWDANSEPDLAGYRIYYGQRSRDYTQHVDAGNVTTYTVTGLEPGKTYYFAATAYNTSGQESGFSNEVSTAVSQATLGNLSVLESTDPNSSKVFFTNTTAGESPRGAPEGRLSGAGPETDVRAADSRVGRRTVDEGVEAKNNELSTLLPEIEFGEVWINHEWTRVTFSADKVFVDPVVVAKLSSRYEDEPVVVRIADVDSTGFAVKLQEWDYLDGTHAAESVSYLVVERGAYVLPGNIHIDAGVSEMKTNGGFQRVKFRGAMEVTPVVLTSVTSRRETDAVTVRLRNVNSEGFEIQLQEEEASPQLHCSETASHIAWEPSLGALGSLRFEVRRFEIDHESRLLRYQGSFTDVPVLLTGMQTSNELDTADVRAGDNEPFGVWVSIEEEQSLDRETQHAIEVVGYLSLSVH